MSAKYRDGCGTRLRLSEAIRKVIGCDRVYEKRGPRSVRKKIANPSLAPTMRVQVNPAVPDFESFLALERLLRCKRLGIPTVDAKSLFYQPTARPVLVAKTLCSVTQPAGTLPEPTASYVVIWDPRPCRCSCPGKAK